MPAQAQPPAALPDATLAAAATLLQQFAPQLRADDLRDFVTGASVQPVTIPGKLLKIEQVAERLAVSTRSVKRMIADGRLPHRKLGKSVRVPEAALLAL